MRISVFILIGFLLLSNAFAQNLVINEVMSANVNTIADEDDDYMDWIEIYNTGGIPINLNGYGLSDDEWEPFKWTFPNIDLDAEEFLLIFASGKDRTSPQLHANFKIKSIGEPLILTNPSGETIDQIETGCIPTDISLGHQPDGEADWYYFSEPTPDSSNSTQGYPEISPPPEFSLPGGLYSGSLNLSLETTSPQAVIRYTIDGSPPFDSSMVYSLPLLIDSTTVIRVRAFETGLLYSNVVTHSYIFYQNNDLSVVSISTDPVNLWDEETGIYVLGNNAGPPQWYYGANYWEDWEKPVHLEYFEPDGEPGFSLDAGVKIYGGLPRTYPQKSLSVFARDKYGCDEINYQIFPEKVIDEFQSFLLRNSGNDWYKTMMRDALLISLADDFDIDVQAYKPSILFINGEYWGIHNIREKITKHFLASNHGIDPNNIDLLENDALVLEGDAEHYDEMLDFIETNDMTVMENYEYIKTQMDVNNYIDYQASEIYFANTDWPGNNIRYWRPREMSGKWKWILYDTDFGFGLYNGCAHNTLAFATAPNGTSWPNPDWSTFLFRSLLENISFRNDYINRSADLLNFDFHPDRVIERIDSISAIIESEMSSHQMRWDRTIEQWYDELDVLLNFAEHRADFVRIHIQEEFDLEGMAAVLTDIEPHEGGSIKINTRTIPEYPWEGIYFLGVPIQFTALPEYGYRFSGWIGVEPSDSSSIWVDLTGDTSITAVFEQDSTSSDSIVINEINYHSADDFDPNDWVEIYNNACDTVDLSGWIFKDENDNHIFTFPPNTVIESGAYLVLCRDTIDFSTIFPDVFNYIGNFDFGLSNGGELIRLFDADEHIIDSLTYDDDPPWPEEPDGNGPTLELSDPSLPNFGPENWLASTPEFAHGTPGAINSNYHPAAPESLFINEFMADNTETIPDPQGEYDDWIEIWNGGTGTLDFFSLYLTDDSQEPLKWALPDTFLLPGEFMLVWADDDEGDPGIHANFKLAAAGEEIFCFFDDDGTPVIIDSVSFGPQQPDTSCGRCPDGGPQWQPCDPATPGFSNSSAGLQTPEICITVDNITVILEWYPLAYVSHYQVHRSASAYFEPGPETLLAMVEIPQYQDCDVLLSEQAFFYLVIAVQE